jgi:hypothetical protein
LMLIKKKERSAIRTLRGWAMSVLQDAHAIHDAAVAELREVLDSIGDTCPECSPE